MTKIRCLCLSTLLWSLAAAACGHPDEVVGNVHRWPTVAEVMSLEGTPLPTGDAWPLSSPIDSFEVLNDERGCVIAGFLGGDHDHVSVFRFDQASGRWSTTTLHEPPLGSVVAIERMDRYVAIGMHLSPSAVSTVVLDAENNPHDRLYGWVVATLPKARAVVQRSMVHFAPIHALELFVYDAASRRSWNLLPDTDRDPIRGRLVEEMKSFYDRLGWQWCATNNDPCDPNQLDSDVARQWFDAKSDTLSILIAFRGPSLDPEKVSKYVLYEFRHPGQTGAAFRELDVGGRLPDLADGKDEAWLHARHRELWARRGRD
jgi:hypothetical protein